MEFVLFLPQMRLSFDDLVARAKAAEAAGFTGLSGMDHLVPPLADDQPMYEAIVTSTWLAAHTERLRLGSLVLCDAFRHPAVLAREAVSIDHAKAAVATGSASVGDRSLSRSSRPSAPDRPARLTASQRLRETLEVLQGPLGRRGRRLRRRVPPPPECPAGPAPSRPHPHRDRWRRQEDPGARAGARRLVEPPRRPPAQARARSLAEAGSARVSIEQVVGLRRQALLERAAVARLGQASVRVVPARSSDRRASWSNTSVVWRDQGVDRVYAWFTDFAVPEHLIDLRRVGDRTPAGNRLAPAVGSPAGPQPGDALLGGGVGAEQVGELHLAAGQRVDDERWACAGGRPSGRAGRPRA